MVESSQGCRAGLEHPAGFCGVQRAGAMKRSLTCYAVGIMDQAIFSRRPEAASLVSDLQKVGAPIFPTVQILNVSSLCQNSEVGQGPSHVTVSTNHCWSGWHEAPAGARVSWVESG